VPNTNQTAEAIQEMVRFFLPRCADKSTLHELDKMAADDEQWEHARDLFGRIREKTLLAIETQDERLQPQYAFEEICAKTLFNMSGSVAPFDADSPFWVVPLAVGLARSLGVSDPCLVSSLLR